MYLLALPVCQVQARLPSLQAPNHRKEYEYMNKRDKCILEKASLGKSMGR